MTHAPPPSEAPASSSVDVLTRIGLGLGLWAAGITAFAAAVWVRTYTLDCKHRAIFHRSDTSIDRCDALLSSGGVLRTGSAFFELVLLVAVVVVPLLLVVPALRRARRAA